MSILIMSIPIMSKHKVCETCRLLEREPSDWGFTPFCAGREIPLIAWEWVKLRGCASYRSKEE